MDSMELLGTSCALHESDFALFCLMQLIWVVQFRPDSIIRISPEKGVIGITYIILGFN